MRCQEEQLVVREFEAGKDSDKVEAMEKTWQVEEEEAGKPCLYVDCMGDPICRIRHSPLFLMLVAEVGDEIVGVVRGTVKTLTTGKSVKNIGHEYASSYAKVAYILGLRVSPSFRRQGIATELVRTMEEWCKGQGAVYVYIATVGSNRASLNLFTIKCGYSEFRRPTILVRPVHPHRVPVGLGITVVRLPPRLALYVYRRAFSGSEFFPMDIESVLSNKLNMGTFLALPTTYLPWWDPSDCGSLPPSYAVLSLWNTKELYKLQVKGVSRVKRVCCRGIRFLDTWLPFIGLPSIPNWFKPFGVYFMYGLHMQGKYGRQLMRGLCNFSHNLAVDGGASAVVAELGQADPVVEAVPHWRRFSSEEDVWCMKWLGQEGDGPSLPHLWALSEPINSTIFVDPREF